MRTLVSATGVEFCPYRLQVSDPGNGATAVYDLWAVSARHAERQAREAFTGLDGDFSVEHARLQVEFVERPIFTT
jgi:hypothetical protein